MKKNALIILLLFACTNLYAQRTGKKTISQEPFSYNTFFNAMKWRSIGPFRGGRSVAVSGVPGNSYTYFMGVTGGGVWKTEDLGHTWFNVSDPYFGTGSVGAIAVSQSDPNIVYVGMGEHAPRGVMTHHGDGVYKSHDQGKTWLKLGLETTQHISRIIIHPKNPDIVYVAAQGALYGNNKERGVYKSVDGGKNWRQVLYVNEMTGASELSMDANNPLVLYAAMWEHGRLPWQVKSGGPGSGLYKSTDGGETWFTIHNGLPKELGKMAIAVAPSNSEKVYALIESDSEKDLGGLFVSNNGGQSWSRSSEDRFLIQRAWYYIELFIDPKNEDVVYVLSASAFKSIDGGYTWEEFYGIHGDYHDLWINPDNPKNMIMADDGGAAITVNGAKTWSTQSNMPTAQLYRINVDNQFPYRIYAGQQDNTSVVIASREFHSAGITRESWEASAGGESAFLAFDPDNPRYVMGGSYQGTIEVLDTKAKASTKIMSSPNEYLGMDAKDMRYRFNWNAPIIWSQHEENTFYHAAQVLLKTTDMGKTWTEVSPDLTRNEKSKQGKPGIPYTNEAVGAENYNTISYVIESPHEKGVIWTGSDDGLVHLTRDGGKTWLNVTPTGLKECLVNAIELSPHDKATAYIATTRYKFNDHTPGLYKTTDYGKTWTSINNGIPNGSFTRVVREDNVRKDLLYAGTELGVFMSFDGGKNWRAFQLNLPITPITDLKVHQGNLIAATSGRSFWILDDLFLLQQFNLLPYGLELFKPADVMLNNYYSELDDHDPEFDGTHPLRGVNPASGLVLYYHLDEIDEDKSVKIEIKDAYGDLVRSFTSEEDEDFFHYPGGPHPEPVLPKQKGLNRFVWDLRHTTITGVPAAYIEASFAGHKAIPGKYTVIINYGGAEDIQPFEILPNPLYPTDAATYQAYHELRLRMEKEVSEMHEMVNTMMKKMQQMEKILNHMEKAGYDDQLIKRGNLLFDRMETWDSAMVQRKSRAYDDVENYPNMYTANYMFLLNQIESDIPVITQAALDRLKELEAEWAELKAEGIALLRRELLQYNMQLWQAGIGALWEE